MEENLTEEHPFNLLKNRLENLEEKIDKSFDEIVEMKQLASICKEDINHASTPLVNLRRLAILESARVNLFEIREEIEEAYSNLDQSYIELIKRSWLNTKSLTIITNQGNEIGKEVFFSWNFYKIYPPNPPKITLQDWIWQKKQSLQRDLSEIEAWQSKVEWHNYSKNRLLKISSCQQVINRLMDLATSPIYDEMNEITPSEYVLKQDILLKETNKTFVFSIPFNEFRDIPYVAKASYAMQYASFIQVAFVLPECAHERQRFFTKKGASLANFYDYIQNLDIELNDKLQNALHFFDQKKMVKFYRECLPTNSAEKISGYFLSPRKTKKGYKVLEYLREALLPKAVVRSVLPGFTWYPLWMRNCGGIVVEPLHKDHVSLPIDEFTYQTIYGIFAPEKDFQKLPENEYLEKYKAQMRILYKKDPGNFVKFAKMSYQRENIRNGVRHIPYLREIFAKVYETL